MTEPQIQAAITNALYALNPNQGERADPTAAAMWLRTTLPADHPNYLDWAYVESRNPSFLANRGER